jgi:hypothetical protein
MTDVCRCPKIHGNECVLTNLWQDEDKTVMPEPVSIRLPMCKLSLEEQIADIESVYTSENREHMLPPYCPLQVSGMEVDGGFRFPPVLRHYLTNISRQLRTFFPVLVQPFQYSRQWPIGVGPNEMSSYASSGPGGGVLFDADRNRLDEFHVTGCEKHISWPHAINARDFCDCHIIWLGGGLGGYVQYSSPEPRPIVNTLYAFLRWLAIRMDPSPSGHEERREVQRACLEDSTLIDQQYDVEVGYDLDASSLVLAGFARFNDILHRYPLPIREMYESYGIPERVPENLKNARCIGLCERLGFRIVKGDEDAWRCFQSLVPYVLRIQRQFRLWRWRKDVYWNPHTKVGRLGLEVQSRAFIAMHSGVIS